MLRYIYLIILIVALHGNGLAPQIISVHDYEDETLGHISVKSIIIDESLIKNVKVFYREPGGSDYLNTDMYRVSDGYLADLDPEEVGDEIEYYLLAQDDDGNTSRFPDEGELISNVNDGENIDAHLISPKQEIEFTDGVPIVIISLWDPDQRIDINDLNLIIDNIDVTSTSSISFDMITYVPKEVFTAGDHSIEIFLENKVRGKYGSRKLKFNIKEKPIELADVRSSFINALSPSGGITWDSDYDEAESRPDDNQKFNAKLKFKLLGADVSGTRSLSTHFIDMDALELLDTKQDADRYKISVASKFADYSFGDLSPQFSDFTLKGARIRGHHLRLKLGILEAFFTTGEMKHALASSTITATPEADSIWTHNDINDNGIIDYLYDLSEEITAANTFDDCDGTWDELYGHCYIDSNGNGTWDYNTEFFESFTDCGYSAEGEWLCEGETGWDSSYGNGIWNTSEQLLDLSQEACEEDASGVWGPANAICFIDTNSNGLWDKEEVFSDTTAGELDGYRLSDQTDWLWSQHGKGTPLRIISGLRTQLNLFKKMKVGASMFRAYDNRNSIDIDDLFIDQYAMYGNVVLGFDMELRLNKNRTVLKAETAFSGMNDILGSDSLLTNELGGEAVSEAIADMEEILGYDLTDDLLLGTAEGRGLSVAMPTGDDIWNHEDTDGDGQLDDGEFYESFIDCGYSQDGVWMCEGNDDWDESYGNGIWNQSEEVLNLSQNECADEQLAVWDASNGICFIDSDGDGYWEQEEIFFDNPIKNINMLSYIFNDVLGRGTYMVSFATPVPIKNIKMDYNFELKRVPSNFSSMGNSSIRADYFGFKTGTKIRVWKDQVSFNLSYDRNSDNVNGVDADDKLKSATTTSQTLNMGSGINFPGWPVLNYSLRSKSRESISVSAGTTTVKSNTISHTLAPSYKFDVGTMDVNLSGNLFYMNYDDTFNTANNFISTTTSFNIGLSFKSPLAISSGVGTSTNLPANSSQKPTLFIVYNGKLGYKFFDKKLSTILSGSYVVGEQEEVLDENGEVVSGIDSQKLSLKLGVQYKINSKISVSLNVDRVDLVDSIDSDNNKEEMRGKVKISLNI